MRKIKGVSGLMKKILIEKEEKSRECKQLNMFVIDMKIYQKISNDGCTFMKRNHFIVTMFIIYLFIYLFIVVDFISPQVALVMTDGKQTVRNDTILSSDILSAAVQPLKDKNVKVISLGIGKNTNLFDLMTIASSSDDVYLAENFAVLKGLVANLTQNKCPGRLVTYF